jgi:hypothetical protein
VDAPVPDDRLSFFQAVEDLIAQAFVSELVSGRLLQNGGRQVLSVFVALKTADKG